MAHRYAHARQMRRCRREQRKLKTYLGRLYREMERKADKEAFSEIGLLIKRLLTQERHDKEKLYMCLFMELEKAYNCNKSENFRNDVKGTIKEFIQRINKLDK